MITKVEVNNGSKDISKGEEDGETLRVSFGWDPP